MFHTHVAASSKCATASNNNSSNNNMSKAAAPACVVCNCPLFDASAATCSLRCDWSQTSRCVQCGRGRDTGASFNNNNNNNNNSKFCSANCADESKRGNWCCVCGVRQVPQGHGACSHACQAAKVSMLPSTDAVADSATAAAAGAAASGAFSDSPFPSRKNSPNEGTKRAPLRTVSAVDPHSKLFERIATPFQMQGAHPFQVLQLHSAPADKKAYAANRLEVDGRLKAQKIVKFQGGGEGCEHKKFVPLLAGCGTSHINGPQFTADGHPIVCEDPACDVCRVISSGMKLSAMSGRTSHFSVPTLEAALPWCADAATTLPDGATRVCAVALVRVVMGNVHMCDDISMVAPPPIGFDSVVLRPRANNPTTVTAGGAQVPNDQTFSFADTAVQPEYIVLFAAPAQQSQPSMMPPMPPMQMMPEHHQFDNSNNNFDAPQQQRAAAPQSALHRAFHHE